MSAPDDFHTIQGQAENNANLGQLLGAAFIAVALLAALVIATSFASRVKANIEYDTAGMFCPEASC